jgi:4-diphosphocytidyl-2-C-methyl-D-erythritol kinase
VPAARAELAPAKVNLTLHVIGRRADGYHDIESLVAFAAVGDALTFTRGSDLSLVVRGPTAAASGEVTDNLVLRAARQLSDRIEGLKLGRFALSKRLPVAAGVGGGSADAAAALRLLARANHVVLDDPRVMAAARATGADVPVCLDPRPRRMRGIGEILSDPFDLPKLPAVLVNPRVAVPTKDVFAALGLQPGTNTSRGVPSRTDLGRSCLSGGTERSAALLRALMDDRNDLEAPAIGIQPIIADVLNELRALPGCRLARMSGSGATCFGLFDSGRAATAAAQMLRANHSDWWIRATTLG